MSHLYAQRRIAVEAAAVSAAVIILSLFLFRSAFPGHAAPAIIPLVVGIFLFIALSAISSRRERAMSEAYGARDAAIAEVQRLELRLAEVQAQLRSDPDLLCMCSWCKSIRDPAGEWRTLEGYLELHMRTAFTHGACPECMRVEYPTLFE